MKLLKTTFTGVWVYVAKGIWSVVSNYVSGRLDQMGESILGQHPILQSCVHAQQEADTPNGLIIQPADLSAQTHTAFSPLLT